MNLLTGVILLTGISFYGCGQAETDKETAGETAATEEAAKRTGELMKRSEIYPKYTWNLTDLYASDSDWEKEYKDIEKKAGQFESFEGKLGSSAATLEKFLNLDKELSEKLEKLRMYASLSKDLDLADAKYQAMYERLMNLYNKISESTSWVRPELLSIPQAKLESYIESSETLQHFRHYFDNILRFKPHTLPKEQELLLSMANPVEQTFMTNYRLWSNADIQFPKVKDENGNEVQMSHARYYSALTSLDRGYRERAYKAIYVPFMNNINFLASNYSGSIKAKIFNAKARNYENTLDAALFQNNIPVEVYQNLVNTVNENLDPLHRWAALKKKLLKINDLHPYDTYVTLFPAGKKEYTPDEAMEMCLEALKPLGEDYINNLKFAFENRWVDFYETKGKRSGAYSTGAAKGVHPYVLMNWGYTLNDVFTLIHEMGHNMHSWYTANNQEYPYADYPIFVAEVASITNESLLLNYLIENAETKDEKLYLIETALNNMKGTFFRQTRFAEFEMRVQSMMEAGEAFTPDKYAEVFGEMYKKYWGDEMVVDEEEKNSWPRIHHFYYNFYVYQYATSYAAAEAVAAKILNDGQPAVDKYLNFLKSGKSEYAIPTLKKAGVDMSTREPILAVINKANILLDQMEELLGE